MDKGRPGKQYAMQITAGFNITANKKNNSTSSLKKCRHLTLFQVYTVAPAVGPYPTLEQKKKARPRPVGFTCLPNRISVQDDPNQARTGPAGHSQER